MQDCFRLHPEMYGSELEDDEDEGEDELLPREDASSAKTEAEPSVPPATPATPAAPVVTPPSEPEPAEQTISGETPSEKQPEKPSNAQADEDVQSSIDTPANNDKDDELIPKAAHDATKN